MIRQKCPTCGNYAEVPHSDDGTGCFVPSDKDKVIAELEKELESQIGGADFEINAMVATETMLRAKLEDQVAYGQSLRSTLSRMLKDDFSLEELNSALALSPSPQLLNKLKADAVREMIGSIKDGRNTDGEWILMPSMEEYSNQLEQGGE